MYFIYTFIEFVTVSVKLAEQNGIIREESTYTLNSLVSDIGGALGLVLGLSILDLLIPVSDLLRKVCDLIGCTFRNSKNSRFQNLEEAHCTVSCFFLLFSDTVQDSQCSAATEVTQIVTDDMRTVQTSSPKITDFM